MQINKSNYTLICKTLDILLMPFADQLKAIEQEKEENRKYQGACAAIHEIRGKEVRAKGQH
jgi:hypothetical protein